MKKYAFVVDGVVREIVEPGVYDAESPEWVEGEPSRIGKERPIELCYTPEFVQCMVDVTTLEREPGYGWLYDGMSFLEPEPYVASPEEVRANNIAYRDGLLSQAALALAPLQYADDLGEATEAEKAQLLAWKRYMVGVNRVDLSLRDSIWPEKP